MGYSPYMCVHHYFCELCVGGMNNTTTSARDTARDLTNGRFSAHGFIEDFDADGLLILPEEVPQQLVPEN